MATPRSKAPPPDAKPVAAGPRDAKPAAGGPRVLKKYPNRRLYDTRHSSYITLADVKTMVLAGEHFEVRDAKTAPGSPPSSPAPPAPGR